MNNGLTWYINRLSCMTGAEVIHRIKTKLSTSIEKRNADSNVNIGHLDLDSIRLKLLSHISPEAIPEEMNSIFTIADNIIAGKLTIFSLQYQFDDFPDWNKDPKTGISAPLIYGKTMNYRDETIVGDIKYLWEPSRHLHFPALAIAYQKSGNIKYLKCLSQHARSWIDQCPYLLGPHWISSLELGIRLINWGLTWNILGKSLNDLFNLPNGKKLQEDWLKVIYQHMLFIDGHYSRHSSANNHLIGEAAGVYISSMFWPLDKHITKLGIKAKTVLEKEADKQNFSDGVNKEQAISYQQFVLDFLLLPYLVGIKYNDEFSRQYSSIIENMMSYLASLLDINGNIPMIGDADDGYVFRLDYAADHCPYKSLLATGSALFYRTDFKNRTNSFDNRSWLLLGDKGLVNYQSLNSNPSKNNEQIPQIKFPQGGYYLLGDNSGCKNEYRMIFDIGPLGYGGIAAHGHADSLSVYLSVKGREFFIDPGTFAYHTDKKWRDYFKGTSAHNTIRIDEQDQSQSGGNFMWVKKAKSELVKWTDNENQIGVSGKHNGYQSIVNSVVHQRNITLNKTDTMYIIIDEIICKNAHKVEQFWHLSEECDIQEKGNNTFSIHNNDVTIQLEIDNKFKITIEKGNNVKPVGWVSRAFDLKVPSYTIIGTTQIKKSQNFETKVRLR